MLEKLIKSIKYKDEFYYIQMAEKRIWYQTLEGKVLELPNINENGKICSYSDFVVTGKDIYDAMERMIKFYLEDEEFKQLLVFE